MVEAVMSVPSSVRATWLRVALVVGLACGGTLEVRPAHAHDIVQPRPKTQPPPSWPNGHAETHDVVVPVVLVVSEDGHVTSAEVEASVSPAFNRAAIAAATTWTFEPAMRDGKVVSAKIRSVVRFAGASSQTSEVQVAPATPPPMAVAPGTRASAPAPGAPAPSEAGRDVRVTGVAPPRSASEVVRERDT